MDIAIGPTAGLTWFKLLDIASEPTAANPLGIARPTTVAMRSKWLMSCWHQFVTMASVYDARLIRKCEARLACLLACHIMYTNE